MSDVVWEFVAHVDPPPAVEEHAVVFPAAETETFSRSLTYYLGPNHYPAGVYLPDGHDLEKRPGDDPEWTIWRARDSTSGQVLTIWALRNADEDGNFPEGELVKILDP